MKQTAAHSAKRSGHGGIGRLGGFRFHCQKRAGSSPVARTTASVLIGFDVLWGHSFFCYPLCAGS